MTKVGVFGAKGRMGATICVAVESAPGLELVAACDADQDREPMKQADVAIDFTHPSAVMDNILWCIDNGIDMVVGTSGFDDDKLDQVREWLGDNPRTGVLIASNFSIAAVLMMKFAAMAAPYFESVEVIEMHHPRKADAPSGTAAATARLIAEARTGAGCAPMPDATTQDPQGARGAVLDGVHVHSVRLQGLFALQEVVFGNPGEMLTIRDDGFDRASYLPGVLAAVRAVKERKGLTWGIDDLLGLGV